MDTVPEKHRSAQVIRREESLLRISSFYPSYAESGDHMDRVSWGRLGPSKGHLFLLGTRKEMLQICVTQTFLLQYWRSK